MKGGVASLVTVQSNRFSHEAIILFRQEFAGPPPTHTGTHIPPSHPSSEPLPPTPPLPPKKKDLRGTLLHTCEGKEPHPVRSPQPRPRRPMFGAQPPTPKKSRPPAIGDPRPRSSAQRPRNTAERPTKDTSPLKETRLLCCDGRVAHAHAQRPSHSL